MSWFYSRRRPGLEITFKYHFYLDGKVDGWMEGWVDGWVMNAWMDGGKCVIHSLPPMDFGVITNTCLEEKCS